MGKNDTQWQMFQLFAKLMTEDKSSPNKQNGANNKGKGKGGSPGASSKSSPRDKRKPNDKPLSQRASKTEEEYTCSKCGQSNWLSKGRETCRSCQHPAPQWAKDKISGTKTTESPKPLPVSKMDDDAKEAIRKKVEALETLIAS